MEKLHLITKEIIYFQKKSEEQIRVAFYNFELTLKGPYMKITEFANRVDSDEAADAEQTHCIYTVCSLAFEFSI